MYLIWHKKLGLLRTCKFKIQVLIWQLKHGKDENIIIVDKKEN